MSNIALTVLGVVCSCPTLPRIFLKFWVSSFMSNFWITVEWKLRSAAALLVYTLLRSRRYESFWNGTKYNSISWDFASFQYLMFSWTCFFCRPNINFFPVSSAVLSLSCTRSKEFWVPVFSNRIFCPNKGLDALHQDLKQQFCASGKLLKEKPIVSIAYCGMLIDQNLPPELRAWYLPFICQPITLNT